MEDTAIIELYWLRDENAVGETDKKYGAFCRKIASTILDLHEDCEECVSDTWWKAWDTMPPQRPQSLKAYLGRITRNLSISRLRQNRAQKRDAGATSMLSELEDCKPSGGGVEQEIERGELTRIIENWLMSLKAEDRALFVRRYWYGDAVSDLAFRLGVKPSQLAKRMYNLRLNLKETLEREGVVL